VDGLLVIDKPVGPTSHDVVAAVRRASGELRVGHAGTLDPMASGVLVVLLGRATRLARYYAGTRKSYVAGISLSGATDTYDAEGTPQAGAHVAGVPDSTAVLAALDRFRGTFAQVPPPFSAKKVAGARAYELARRARPVTLAPVTVTVHELAVLRHDGPLVEVSLVCSAGFYVRALAHDLGQTLGCGAHLVSLRRTASGTLDAGTAVPLGQLGAGREDVARHLRPLVTMLEWLPAAVVGFESAAGVAHGRPVPPGAVVRWLGAPPAERAPVRLIDEQGRLLAVADGGRVAEPLRPTTVLA
jgi:tRNA pseudouridine55 synthase